MVIGLLILTAIPTVTGVAQAISGQKTREERQKDENRMKKFHIDIHCEADNARTTGIHDKRLVLKDDRVWLGPHEAQNPCPEGYVAQCFYIEYPDNEVRDDPPLLNWLYVDKDTMELKYGNKSASIEHHIGPWDWAEDEKIITFDKSKGFTAVQDPKTRRWQIYHDMDNDGLSRFVSKGRRMVQVSLQRTLLSGASVPGA
ncbi:hypothetical protein LTR92_002442 [Exophiala xenobiotica]|nr:hypothetical protein LTR92_002442 [Exophiala xenobiotica]KAK5302310.1 hypothetical protein LTR14_000559 [Exophiala xenobiotica]KAK5530663.1 hypothetical protein LTR23_010258 [Chaetothyriales sp. CCFEE 6169]